jgi:intracellular sulfur oxidation DsrE/DsrF family protein
MVKLTWGRRWKRWFAFPALFVVALGIGGVVAENVQAHVHRIVFQVNADDPVPMKHAVSNSINLVRHYRELNESVIVEIVAYGPGINMFRADTSPVRDILEYMRSNFPEIAFTVCGSTKVIIEQREGHAMPLIEGTRVVPFGIVRLVELQEVGWSYIRP